MFIYATLGVSDFNRSICFFDAIMATLGVERAPGWSETFKGWRVAYEEGFSLWICSPFAGGAPSPGNGPMLALRAHSKEQIHLFHEAALLNGGSDEGPPGPRPNFGDNFYACYVRDPDGNKLACVLSPLS